MKKLYKLLFFSSMISGSLITVSANNWLGMWMGLEINLMSIIPMLSSQKNACESEAALKYFITQAMASTVFLMSIMLMMSNTSTIQSKTLSSTMVVVMNASILTKMGAAPFHFWFVEVMEGLTWTNALIMMTWQKLAPMTILLNSNKSDALMTASIISSLMISGIMGINQTSLRKIMAFSSINHIAWMLGAMMSNQTIWLTYLTVYSLMTTMLTWMLNENNLMYMNQLMNTMTNSKQMKMMFSMNFLSMGGIPPFIGFLPKWLTINFMIQENMFLLSTMMIILTLPTLYFYMRITLSCLTLQTKEMKTKNKFMQTWMPKMNFMTLISLPVGTLMLNFM